MDVKSSIVQAFRDLVSASSYQQTNIRLLCREAHISTRTFYRYFSDKEALLREIIMQDFIEPSRTARAIFDTSANENIGYLLFAQILVTVKAHKEFYAKIFSWKTPELMEPYITLVTEHNAESFRNMIDDEASRHFGAYVVAASNAIVIAKWLEGGCQTPPEQLQTLCRDWLYAKVKESTKEKAAKV